MKLYNDKLIKDFEELRLKAYLPTPKDKWTIGWGHTKGVHRDMVITKEQAQKFFEEDMRWVEDTINELVEVGLSQNQYDALASLIVNIGRTQFASSTALRRLNKGDYEGAAEAMTWFNKQKGKTLRGLVRRRQAEKELFLSDQVVDVVVSNTQKIEPSNTMKSLMVSKEVLGGSSALLSGVGAIFGGLVPQAQVVLSVGLSVALIAFGAFFIWNRVQARNKGER